jgi:hypothetical protein
VGTRVGTIVGTLVEVGNTIDGNTVEVGSDAEVEVDGHRKLDSSSPHPPVIKACNSSRL